MNKKGLAFGVAILAACGIGSVYLVSPSDAQGAAMIDACSNLVKSQVKSPSSYRMIDSIFDIKVVNKDDLPAKLDAINSDAIRQGVEKGYFSISEGKAFVEFESQNSFGVMLKGSAQCNFNIYDTSWASFESATVGDRQASMADLIIVSSQHKVDDTFKSKFKYLKYKLFKTI